MSYADEKSKLYKGVEYSVPLEQEAPLKEERYSLAQHRKSRSVCKWFCVILSVVVALFVVVASILGLWAYFWTRHQVRRITVTDRVDLPINDEIPWAELEVFKDRAKLFFDEIKTGMVPQEDLIITADEINGFIAHSDYLRGNAYVTIEHSKFSVDMSLPVKKLPGGKGRYFVATGFVAVSDGKEGSDSSALVTAEIDTLHPVAGVEGKFLYGDFFMSWVKNSIDDQQELVVNIKSGKFMEWIVPDDYIHKKENLVRCIYEDDDDDDNKDVVAFLNAIQGITIKNDAVTVLARRDVSASVDVNVSTPKYSSGGVRKLLAKLLF